MIVKHAFLRNQGKMNCHEWQRANTKYRHYSIIVIIIIIDRLCGLVVRVLGYRSGDPGSIPGTTKKN
jgi:hypothetical protein